MTDFHFYFFQGEGNKISLYMFLRFVFLVDQEETSLVGVPIKHETIVSTNYVNDDLPRPHLGTT